MAKSLRDFTTLLDALGADTTQRSLPILEDVQPVYLVDNLSKAARNRTVVSIYTTCIPSTLAAQFSGFTIVPKFPCRVSRFLPSVNCTWGVTDGNPKVVTASDGNFSNAAAQYPDGAQMFRLSPASMNIYQVGGGPQVPALFQSAIMGRFAAQQDGAFALANVEVLPFDNVLYLTPQCCFYACAVLANTAINIQLQFDFTVDGNKATDSNGLVLVP